MSEEREHEVYRQLQLGQDKYSHFLLAAAAAAIAFSVQQTQGEALHWRDVSLGIAVGLWAFSFYAGCRNRATSNSAVYANLNLLIVEAGKHPGLNEHGQRPEARHAAAQGIRDALEGHAEAASGWGKQQFGALVMGAIAFLVWHVWGMYERTVDPPKQPLVSVSHMEYN